MLDYLHIENIAVIESVDIDFKSGFSVLTGETGAGKSIIIDAIFALMGERTSRELIRHGENRAVVSASFSDIGKTAEDKLTELGFFLDEGNLVIQRTLFADGKGQVKINGLAANVSTLKEIGKLLINIHGQHDSQNLLNPEKHITFIDAYAENKEIKDEYIVAFEDFKQIMLKLKATMTDEDEKKRRIEYLKYQISEIEKADVKTGEVVALKDYLKLSRSSQKVSVSIKSALGALAGGGEEDVYCALDSLKTAKQGLLAVNETLPQVNALLEQLDKSILDIESTYLDAQNILSEIEYDPEKAEQCQTRLDILRPLMLKYGGSEESVLEAYNLALNELSAFEMNDKSRVELEEKLSLAEERLVLKGKALTESRKKAAKEICERICAELSFLDFENAVFTAEIEKGRYTKNGADVTEFLISANVGEEPKPLSKIASGGELSRIMLAIRKVLSLRDDVGTLIFDEIDTGISGRAAGKVATSLSSVAEQRQVICVTHLAQIASAANNHLLINKSSDGVRTYTTVTPLDHSARVREIARIISGSEYTENLLKTAEEMLNNKTV